ncbi:MAG: peroxidase family protein, partial [Myxococcota bacterium]
DKLTQRDMGPHARLLGAEDAKPQIWQDPVPKVNHPLVDKQDIKALKAQILQAKIAPQVWVNVAWASGSTYRDTDHRGGANGARLRLAPQKDWSVNEPAKLTKALAILTQIQQQFQRKQTSGKKISMADLIVLAGAAAIENAAKLAGHTIEVPFAPGRTDATQAMTDVSSFAYLKPPADGFRNYLAPGTKAKPQELLVDRADMLTLTAPEMAVLLAGLRVLDTNHRGVQHGVLTTRPDQLTNDFFVNLLDMDTVWKKKTEQPQAVYEGRSRESGKVKWTATAVDLVFGANAQLRALAEVYAADDAKAKFVRDFVAVWTKVMRLDRFALQSKRK